MLSHIRNAIDKINHVDVSALRDTWGRNWIRKDQEEIYRSHQIVSDERTWFYRSIMHEARGPRDSGTVSAENTWLIKVQCTRSEWELHIYLWSRNISSIHNLPATTRSYRCRPRLSRPFLLLQLRLGQSRIAAAVCSYDSPLTSYWYGLQTSKTQLKTTGMQYVLGACRVYTPKGMSIFGF